MSQGFYEMIFAAIEREKEIELDCFYRLPDFNGIQKSVVLYVLLDLAGMGEIGFKKRGKNLIIFIRKEGLDNGKD